MFVFVTGVAGSGKSTLGRRLAASGIDAHDADEGTSRHVRVSDGAEVETPPRAVQTPEWVARHEFRFDVARVSELRAGATPGKPVVLLGAAYGDDEVVALADRSWYLDIDRDELRRRLAGRPADGYGQRAHELEAILAWHAAAAERYEGLGARRLDAARPVDEIANELLAGLAAPEFQESQRLP